MQRNNANLGEKLLRLQSAPGVIKDSDLANAERLVLRHGKDLQHTLERGWLVWDGQRFVADGSLAMEKAKETAKSIYSEIESAGPETQKAIFPWVRRSQAAERIRAMLSLAQSDPGVSARLSDFDKDPYLLNCDNGTIDLRTGELREHRREDLCTKITPITYDPAAPCTIWLKFLYRVLDGNEDLIAYLQRAFGYSLTGLIWEQILLFLHGIGANGKSVFLEILIALLGEYAVSTIIETIIVKQRGIPNDVARLAGARVVAVSETAEGQRLNESLVKDLTGGDTVTARFLHREFFDFRPEFKLWIRGNHHPQIRGTDDGKADDADAYNNLGVAYLRLSDIGMALEQYEILLRLDSCKANILHELINK